MFCDNPGIRKLGTNFLYSFISFVQVANGKDDLRPRSSQPLADSEADATVCASDDSKHSGLIGNVNIFVRDQRCSFAGSLGCGAHMCSLPNY